MLRAFILASILAFAPGGARSLASDAGASAPPATVAPDYSQAADWVCRPGSESICTTGLDATVVDASGATKPLPFVPAANPRIDCFYVYPTVSQESSGYSDLHDSPEIQSAVKAQVGRLSSRCRVFAPIYRQATLAHLRNVLDGGPSDDETYPQDDVAAAWASYLAHDNRGRGVAIIGHSQGTILLQELIAKAIDGTSAQKLLVSAFLAGDPSLAIPPGKRVGGTFSHIPVCASAAEIGCAYVWGTYLDGDRSEARVFGAPRLDGMTSACVSPAAPGGGPGALKYYRGKRSDAPAGDPPWVEAVGQFSGECRADAAGDSFFVTVLPGTFSASNGALLRRSGLPEGWGIHTRDIGLVQGNMLDVLDAEIATWRSHHTN